MVESLPVILPVRRPLIPTISIGLNTEKSWFQPSNDIFKHSSNVRCDGLKADSSDRSLQQQSDAKVLPWANLTSFVVVISAHLRWFHALIFWVI